MVSVPDNRGWLVWCSLFCGLILGVMPLPPFMEVGRPLWVGLLIAWWGIHAPHHIGMTRSWLLGLATDVLHGSLLGLHALELALTAYIILNLHQRLRMFPAWQQSFALLAVFALVQSWQFWLSNLAGMHPPFLLFMLPALVSALLWPWVAMLMGWLDRHRPFH